MTGMYIQMAAALLFVLLLIMAVAYVIKKKQNRFGLMSVVGYQPFGAKKGVAALKVGSDVMILGVTPSDMRLLKVYKDTELELNENEGFQSKLEKFKGIGALRN
jgi:flagellar biogenesis protein FliO